MIKHVIFDLGNVIVEIHPQDTMHEFARRCEFSEEEIRKFYLSELHLGFMGGNYTPAEFYRRMMQRFPCNISQADFFDIWSRVIGKPKDGIEQLVNQLSKQYTLSLCSNTDPWHWKISRQACPFFSRFSHFFLSFELKMNKPDRRVFEYLLQHLNAQPHECVFIDDTAENIAVASGMGMRGILTEAPSEMKTALQKLGVILEENSADK